MKPTALFIGAIITMSLISPTPASPQTTAPASAPSRTMQERLRPWMDPTFEKTEGTDSNVREFVAKTIPQIQAALPEKLSAPVARKRRVLVVMASMLGDLHTPGAAGFLIQLREAAKKYGAFEFTEVFSDSTLDATSVAGCDAVILNGVSQLDKGGNTDFYNKVLPEYVRNGGGLLGVHGAALVFRYHPDSPYNQLLGGFTTPGPVHPGKHAAVFPVKVLEPDHPLTAAFRGPPQTCATMGQFLNGAKRGLYQLQFEAPANLTDELYTFNLKSNADGASRVLVAIDKDKLADLKAGPQFPEGTPDFGYALVWIKRHGKGRVFYTQFGHNYSIFSVRCVAQSLMDGLQYVVGDLAAADEPLPVVKSSGPVTVSAAAPATAPATRPADEPFIIKDEALFRQIVPKDAKLQTLSRDFKGLEGPVWLGGDDGFLVFSEMSGSKLIKWTPQDGFKTYREVSFATNGNAVDPQGRIVSCEQGQRRIARVGDDGASVVLADKYQGKKLNSPNDVAIRSDGMIWFTDPRYGEHFGKQEMDGSYVYRFDPAKNELTIASKDFTHPNGICLSPDGKILYVGNGGPGRCIRALDIGEGDKLQNVRDICVVSDSVPDGVKCDSLGNLYVSSGKGVEIFTASGKPIGIIVTSPRASNVCFGGKGLKTLFITGRNCVHRIDLNVSGAKH